jgi:3-isopropylmalate dehydrogenase
VAIDTVDYDLGGARYLRDGTILPDSVLDEWRGHDALLLGAVGAPGVAPGVIERGLLLKMRFDLDLYINQRPFLDVEKGVDMVVIR